MSNITVVLLSMAVGLGHMYIYLSIAEWILEQTDAIATGVFRGVAVSAQHRRMALDSRWIGMMGFIVSVNIIFSLGYALVGQHAEVEGVEWFAYLLAFFSLAGTLPWIAQGFIWYGHLRTTVRQAEAD